MPARLAIVPIAPIGSETTAAFIDYADGRGALERITTATYPPDAVEAGAQLRYRRRFVCDLSLRQAADACGLSVSVYCDLEMGRARAVDAADLDARLTAAATAGEE